MDCSPPGSSVHGILQARKLVWVAIPFSRGSSPPTVWTWVSYNASRYFTVWATRVAHLVEYLLFRCYSNHLQAVIHLILNNPMRKVLFLSSFYRRRNRCTKRLGCHCLLWINEELKIKCRESDFRALLIILEMLTCTEEKCPEGELWWSHSLDGSGSPKCPS